jgi:hypothetical protein
MATDCGHVALDQDSRAVDACVTTAFSSGQPFYARYDLQGIDSNVARGIASNADGEVMLLLWDGYALGESSASNVASIRPSDRRIPKSRQMPVRYDAHRRLR